MSIGSKQICPKYASHVIDLHINAVCSLEIDLIGSACMFDRLSSGLVVSVLLLLAGCGGGGSEGDGTVPLALSPSKIDASSAGCAISIRGPDVKVSGGVPPYSIHNPLPEWVALSTSWVPNAGGSFRVDLVGGACVSEIPLRVTDRDANSVDFIVNYKSAAGE